MSNVEQLIKHKQTWLPFHLACGRSQLTDPSNEEDDSNSCDESLSATQFISSGFAPSSGGPFSAIIPSMWPANVVHPNENGQGAASDDEILYDEFGFQIDEDGPEHCSSRFLREPFIEDPQHRLRWIAYIEFSHAKGGPMGDLTWDQIEYHFKKTDKIRSMIYGKASTGNDDSAISMGDTSLTTPTTTTDSQPQHRPIGVPHSLRPRIWQRLCGSLEKKHKSSTRYKQIVNETTNDQRILYKQIEKDLLRTLPTNSCFARPDSVGIGRLRRILRGLDWLFPKIGYCQGMGCIVATLLLFYDEDDAFWMSATIIDDLLPAEYFTPSLRGVLADVLVLRKLVATCLPRVNEVFDQFQVELALSCIHWFLTIFSNAVHIRLLIRIWDLFFFDGSVVLFKIALGLFKLKEMEIVSSQSSASLLALLTDLPADVQDVEQLLVLANEVGSSIDDSMIDGMRKEAMAQLLSEQGAIINLKNANMLPKQFLTKRSIAKSQIPLAGLSSLWSKTGSTSVFSEERLTVNDRGETVPVDHPSVKNVKQTELMVDLRDAVLKIGRHFVEVDPDRFGSVSLQTDYSMESHKKDLELYVSVAKQRRRRAKALLDFERHDSDELGFRKNDIISVCNMNDEHCWVGELNGVRGWFPAKFVELLDERSQTYSPAGDDSVTESIADIVRGTLCPIIKAILEHGMKKQSLLGRPAHPWLFIEEVAKREVERDFESVYSRLVLCKTFRLDDDYKVLTPEELLYRGTSQRQLVAALK